MKEIIFQYSEVDRAVITQNRMKDGFVLSFENLDLDDKKWYHVYSYHFDSTGLISFAKQMSRLKKLLLLT